MKSYSIKAFLLWFAVASQCISADAQSVWQWGIDSDGQQNERSTDMASGVYGSIYVSGRSNNSFTVENTEVFVPDTGTDHPFLVKISIFGTVDWAFAFNSSDQGYRLDPNMKVAVDSEDNVYIAGRIIREAATGAFEATIAGVSYTVPESATDRDSFLAKIDPSGNGVWVKNLSTEAYQGHTFIDRLVVDQNDYIYWQSIFSMPLEVNGTVIGNPDVWNQFLARYNPDGTNEWFTIMANGSQESTLEIAPAAGGGVLLSSMWLGDTVHVGGLSVVNPDGLFFSNPDRWIAKIGVDGDADWLVREGGPGHDITGSIATTPSGGAMVFSMLIDPLTLNGETFDQPGYILTRYSSDGILEEITTYPSDEIEFTIPRFVADGNHNYYLGFNYTQQVFNFNGVPFTNAGGFNGTRDFVIIALDMNGNVLWGMPAGGAEEDMLVDLDYRYNYGLAVCGHFLSSSINLDINTLENTEGVLNDFFIAALDFSTSVLNIPGIVAIPVFPNPTQAHLSLDLSALTAEPQTLRIFDARGSQVQSQILNGGAVQTIEVGNLPQGNYIAIINAGGVVHASKFIRL